MRRIWLAVVLLFFSASIFGQTSGTTLPTTCITGTIFTLTGANTGTFLCVYGMYLPTGVQTGSGGGGVGTINNITANSNALLGVTINTPTGPTAQFIYTIPNAPANTVWGNFTSGATTPSYSAAPVFSGAGLTALNASSITTGTVPIAQLPVAGTSTLGLVRADNSTIVNTSGVLSAPQNSTFTNITVTGGTGIDGTVIGANSARAITGTTITGTSFVGPGSGLTGLSASNISTGTLAAARVPTLAATGGTIDSTAIGQTTPANGAFLSLLSNAVNFGGGIINNVPIGATTPASGAFSTLASGSATLTGGAIDGMIVGGTTPANGTFSLLTSANVAITGGAINGTPIGATTRSTVQATTVNATSTVIGSNIMAGETVVAFSATPAFASASAQGQIITLTSNLTSWTLANGVAGRGFTLTMCQNATGGFLSGTTPVNVRGFGTIGTTASKCSSQHFVYSGNQAAWIADSAMVINE